MELRDKIRAFIKGKLTIFDDAKEFSDEANIFSLGFVDSMFALQLVRYVEKEFSITVESDDLRLDNFHSVENLSRFVESKLAVR